MKPGDAVNDALRTRFRAAGEDQEGPARWPPSARRGTPWIGVPAGRSRQFRHPRARRRRRRGRRPGVWRRSGARSPRAPQIGEERDGAAAAVADIRRHPRTRRARWRGAGRQHRAKTRRTARCRSRRCGCRHGWRRTPPAGSAGRSRRHRRDRRRARAGRWRSGRPRRVTRGRWWCGRCRPRPSQITAARSAFAGSSAWRSTQLSATFKVPPTK